MTAQIDQALERALNLFRCHMATYETEIDSNPAAWRRRARELFDDLDWLAFAKAHPTRSELPRDT